MSAGTMLVRDIWQALGLELPAKRRSLLKRLFAGLKPMRPAQYASLLRAMARAAIEAGLVPVAKDARHDPVELIASAIEVCVEQWDRDPDCSRRTPKSQDFWNDIAMRVVAFEALFGLPVARERRGAGLAVVVRAIEGDHLRPIVDSFVARLDRARIEVAALAASRPEETDATLAEIVIAGAALSTQAAEWIPSGMPLAGGIVLVRRERFIEALARFEAILDRVPRHALALQLAARCSVEVDAFARANAYATRASTRSRASSCASAISDRCQSGSCELYP